MPKDILPEFLLETETAAVTGQSLKCLVQSLVGWSFRLIVKSLSTLSREGRQSTILVKPLADSAKLRLTFA
jgi:hypothetical protein